MNLQDKLYDAAFRYKKTKLWKHLHDSQMVALRLPDGETGVVIVMGEMGEHCAVGLYVGEEAVKELLRIAFDFSYEESEGRNIFLMQDCIQLVLDCQDNLWPEQVDNARAYAKAHGIRLSGQNAFPAFNRTQPGHLPWMISDEDEISLRRLLCTTEFCIALSEQMTGSKDDCPVIEAVSRTTVSIPMYALQDGAPVRIGDYPLPTDLTVHYPEAERRNDIALAKLKKLPHKDYYEAALVRMEQPVLEEEGKAPVFPMALLIISRESALPGIMSACYDENPDEMIDSLCEKLAEIGTLPREICCRDERTQALLRCVCSRTKITCTLGTGRMDIIDDAVDSFLKFARHSSNVNSSYDEDDSEWDEADDDQDDNMDDLSDQELEALIDAMANDLRRMSVNAFLRENPELGDMIVFLAEEEFFPADVAAKVRQWRRKK